MKYAKLFYRGFEANWKKLLEYKEEFYTTLLGDLIEIGVAIFFWSIIFSRIPQLNGWGMGEILLINGFMYLFYGFLFLFYEGVWSIDGLIIYGKIDRYLSRPVEPLIVEIFSKMDLFALKHFGQFAIFLGVANYLGVPIGWEILLGILMCFLGTTIFALIGMCVQFLSFWLGRTNAIHGLFSILWHFGEYPLTLFPILFQGIFIFIIPIFIVGSVPAMTLTKIITIENALNYIIIELILIGIWTAIAWKLWKTGLKKYDSYGG